MESSLGRLWGALTAPAATFRSLAQRPSWVAAMLLLVLCQGLSLWVMLPKVDWEEMGREIRGQIERQGGGAEEVAAAEKMQKAGAGCFSVAGLLGILLLGVVLAGILKGLTFLGGEISFPSALGVSFHALLPLAVHALLQIPVALSRSEISFRELQRGGLLPSGPSAFLGEDASPRLLAFLNGGDLFILWTLALLILGSHVAAGVSKRAAAIVWVGLWLLWFGGSAALAGLGGAGMS